MKLNHIDLPVSDPASAREFFERHFEMKCVYTREDGLTVLLDEDGFALTLSPLSPGEELKYPTGLHVGFILDNVTNYSKFTNGSSLPGSQSFDLLAIWREQ